MAGNIGSVVAINKNRNIDSLWESKLVKEFPIFAEVFKGFGKEKRRDNNVLG